MKISVSLPAVEVEFLDDYALHHDVGSRSAAVLQAIDLLRQADLAEAYEQAWDEWSSSDDSGLWESTVGDGLRTS